MEARDCQTLFSAHKDRSEITRPAAVRRTAEKIDACEIDPDLLEDATGLSLLYRGVDENADHFARRQRADDFVGCEDRIGTLSASRRMRLPLGR